MRKINKNNSCIQTEMHIILIIGKKIGHRLKGRESEHDRYIEEN